MPHLDYPNENETSLDIDVLPKKKLCQTVAEFESEIKSGTWDKKLLQAAQLYLKDVCGEENVTGTPEEIVNLAKSKRAFLREIVQFILEKSPNMELKELGERYVESVTERGQKCTFFSSEFLSDKVRNIIKETGGIEKTISKCNDLLVRNGIIKNTGIEKYFGDYISQTALNVILENDQISDSAKSQVLESPAVQGLIQSYISGEQKLTKDTFKYQLFSDMLSTEVSNSSVDVRKVFLESGKLENMPQSFSDMLWVDKTL